jgi:hypothetical protein
MNFGDQDANVPDTLLKTSGNIIVSTISRSNRTFHKQVRLRLKRSQKQSHRLIGVYMLKQRQQQRLLLFIIIPSLSFPPVSVFVPNIAQCLT